ncbi:hypothetical protein D3C76_1538270 [compost metagenome]
MGFGVLKQQLTQYAVFAGSVHDIPYPSRQFCPVKPEIERIRQQRKQLEEPLVIVFFGQLRPDPAPDRDLFTV